MTPTPQAQVTEDRISKLRAIVPLFWRSILGGKEIKGLGCLVPKEELDALLDALSAAHARQVEVEELVAALEPFEQIAKEYAAASVHLTQVFRDEGLPGPAPHPDYHRTSIALGACRRAARALARVRE